MSRGDALFRSGPIGCMRASHSHLACHVVDLCGARCRCASGQLSCLQHLHGMVVHMAWSSTTWYVTRGEGREGRGQGATRGEG